MSTARSSRFPRGPALACAIAFATPAAHALPMTFTGGLDFAAPTQAIWGPGQAAADFANANEVGSRAAIALGYSIAASSGTVTARYRGHLSAGYQSSVDLASASAAPISVGFAGTAGGGSLVTSLGAGADAYVYILGGRETLIDEGLLLRINRTFTPVIDTAASGTASDGAVGRGVGPDFPGLNATTGADLVVDEAASLVGRGILGSLIATHRATALTRTVALNLDTASAESVVVDLGLPGIWDLRFADLSLDNRFAVDLDLAVELFAQYSIGLGCGDLGDDDDNGVLCVGDGRASYRPASINLFDNAFGLSFNRIASLDTFSIEVTQQSPDQNGVPEPGSLALVILALGALAATRGVARRA